MHPLLVAALQQASQTGQSVPVTIGNVTLMAYPNGQVGPQGAGGTARWTPAQTSMPVPPRPPYGATPSSTPTTPSGALPAAGPSYTDPTTLQSFSSVPSTGAIIASGPGYGSGTVIPQGSPSVPGSSGPVDRHDAASAANARRYRQMHGLATADDSAATDALNAESLAAAQAGRTYFNPQLAQQYGQPMGAGQYGPRTDVVNALQTPQQGQQPIMLAPTATAAQTQQPPINLLQYLPQQQRYAPYAQSSQYAGNNLLAQGIY